LLFFGADWQIDTFRLAWAECQSAKYKQIQGEIWPQAGASL
jgi:hypothetical protein